MKKEIIMNIYLYIVVYPEFEGSE